MSNESSSTSADFTQSPRFHLFLILLFGVSGCAALIYEIVWFQMLGLVIGSSAISLAVLLGSFMGGMCIGCLALPRIVSAARHPLRVYAFIEGTIGVIGWRCSGACPGGFSQPSHRAERWESCCEP